MAERKWQTEEISETSCRCDRPGSLILCDIFTYFLLTSKIHENQLIQIHPDDKLTLQDKTALQFQCDEERWTDATETQVSDYKLLTLINTHLCIRMCICVCVCLPDRGGSCCGDCSTVAPWRGRWRVPPCCFAVREEKSTKTSNLRKKVCKFSRFKA